MSRKHPHRYVNEFRGRHNMRCADTIDQMRMLVWEVTIQVSGRYSSALSQN